MKPYAILIGALTLIALSSVGGRFWRRKDILDVQERCAALGRAVGDLLLTLSTIERELRIGGNPPGSISKITPKQTLQESVVLRQHLDQLKRDVEGCPDCGGAFGFVLVASARNKLALLDTGVEKAAAAVKAFKEKVQAARRSGRPLP